MLVFIMFYENLCTGDRSKGSVEKEKFHLLSDPSFPQLKFKTNQYAGNKD
jgi:hypothetical protein